MQMTIDNLNISYINKGKGKNVILIPGWNASYKYFNNLINELSKSYNIYSLDLPGFGESSIPTSVFTTHDYALIIYKFMQKLNITNPTLIGHSFGGKTIIDLITTTDIEVKSAILIDSAGIKRKRNFFTKMKNYRYKTLKKMITSLYKGEKQEYLLDDLKKQLEELKKQQEAANSQKNNNSNNSGNNVNGGTDTSSVSPKTGYTNVLAMLMAMLMMSLGMAFFSIRKIKR